MAEQITDTQEKAEVVIKYDSWLFKLIKTHGLSVGLMVVGLIFLNSRLTTAENKITALENRLYDCYEKRIKTSYAVNPTTSPTTTVPLFAVLPEQTTKRRKNGYTFI